MFVGSQTKYSRHFLFTEALQCRPLKINYEPIFYNLSYGPLLGVRTLISDKLLIDQIVHVMSYAFRRNRVIVPYLALS